MSDTRQLFRTPADVRAIPNAQWEAWIRDEHIPWDEFSTVGDVLMAARAILKATRRRMDAQRG